MKEEGKEEERKDRRRRRCRQDVNSENKASGEIDIGKGDNTNEHADGRCLAELFFCDLRRLLVRIRLARQLGQDFVLDKQLVELKALCGEVCTKLGTVGVFQELWYVVGRRSDVLDTEPGNYGLPDLWMGPVGRLYFARALLESSVGLLRWLAWIGCCC